MENNELKLLLIGRKSSKRLWNAGYEANDHEHTKGTKIKKNIVGVYIFVQP